jgi:hypothetical protein
MRNTVIPLNTMEIRMGLSIPCSKPASALPVHLDKIFRLETHPRKTHQSPLEKSWKW